MKNLAIKYKNFTSSFLAIVYIFAVLFAGYFHTHSSQSPQNVDAKFTSSKSNASVEKAIENCFSIHDSQILVGDVNFINDIVLQGNTYYKEYSKDLNESYSKESILFYSLRAPPSI